MNPRSKRSARLISKCPHVMIACGPEVWQGSFCLGTISTIVGWLGMGFSTLSMRNCKVYGLYRDRGEVDKFEIGRYAEDVWRESWT